MVLPKDVGTSTKKTTKCEAMKGKSKTSDEVVFSRATNKPIDPDATCNEAVFWCGVCSCRVNTDNNLNVHHFIGKSHRKNLLKRPLPKGTGSIGPSAKKANIAMLAPSKVASTSASASASIKSVPSEAEKCEDCKMEFSDHKTALSHFKGKRHKSTVTQKAFKKREEAKKNFLSGRGRGAGGGFARGGLKGRGTDKFDFGFSSNSAPKFDLRRDMYVTGDQVAIPSAARGASASLLRRKLISALLEEEERWLGNDSLKDGSTSSASNGFSGDNTGPNNFHNPFSSNNINESLRDDATSSVNNSFSGDNTGPNNYCDPYSGNNINNASSSVNNGFGGDNTGAKDYLGLYNANNINNAINNAISSVNNSFSSDDTSAKNYHDPYSGSNMNNANNYNSFGRPGPYNYNNR